MEFGIVACELCHQRIHALLKVAHLRIALFYHRHRYGILPVRLNDTLALGSRFLHLADVFQLQQSSVVSDIYVFYVMHREYLRVEVDVVSVYAVPHAQCLKNDIVVADSLLYVGICYTSRCSPCGIGQYGDLCLGKSAVVNHRHLWQLLQPLANHVAHQPGCLLRLAAGHIDVKGGNVECAYLHYLRAFHSLRHEPHGTVDFLVHLYKQQTHVAARTECESYYSRISAR